MTTHGLQELNQMKTLVENSLISVEDAKSIFGVESGSPHTPSQPSLPQASGTNVMDLKSCPHKCGADYHTGPLTRQIMNMFTSHSFNPDYDPDKDDTPILCVGSEVEGPVYQPGGYWPDDPFMPSSWKWSNSAWPQPWVIFTDESGPATNKPYYPQYQMNSDQSGYALKSYDELIQDHWVQVGAIKDEALTVKKHPVKWLDDMITGTMTLLQDTLNFTYHYQLETNSWVPGKPEPKECPEITVEFGPDNWVTKHEWFPNGYPQPAIEAAKEIEKHKYPPNITPWGDLSDWIKKTSKEINDSYPKVSYPDETK